MSERMRRVNEALREVVSESVSTLADPRIGFVTVTHVRASPDLAQATVYVSVLGNARRRQRTLLALDAARGAIQQRVGDELRLKRTPKLLFAYDETGERAARINQLLDAADPERGGDPGHDSG
jgi:ribosome-binding factor A